MNNKTAREMFEDLGYRYSLNEDNIMYWNKDEEILFYFEDKGVSLYLYPKAYPKRWDDRKIEAVNKQIEELGWDNETC